MTASGAIAVMEAMQELSDELEHEIFDRARDFLRADNSLNVRAVFDWLAGIAAENEGLVSEATIGTAGSRWLLAQTLCNTIQDSVASITYGAAGEQAVIDMTNALTFASTMHIWRLNDEMLTDPLIEDLTRVDKDDAGD